MIGNKLLPSFYVLTLCDDAADLKFLFGDDFGIQRVEVVSSNFKSDLDATAAAKTAIGFFLKNPRLEGVSIIEHDQLNPEFFPTLEPIKATQEEIQREEDVAEKITASSDQVAIVLTKRFDSLGDHVSAKLSLSGDNLSIDAKIMTTAENFLKEKCLEHVEKQDFISGPHREISSNIVIH